MQHLSIFLGVHKNYGLRHTACVKNIHNELRLLPRIAAVQKLLYVIQLEGFLLYGDLLRLCHDFFNRLLHRLGVSCTEEHILDFLLKLA